MCQKNTDDQTLISIKTPMEDFRDFLEIKENNRIFFSGKFGIGKTFFLREFAKVKEDACFVIHLFPVNYQIRDNLIDIVELIKYDILLELFSKEKELVEKTLEKYNRDKRLHSFFKKNKAYLAKSAFSLLGEFSKLVELTGKSLGVLTEVYETWNSFKRKEEIIIKSFQNRQKDQLKETDFISQFIYNLLQQIQEEKGKETILILDDLDRLDPDNIFRILNVFSAFFEKENENKFGFSKIIIVGDYDNLRKIFHHKYGEETDFEGYMDKFFSIEPFYFDNKKAIEAKVEYLLKNFKTSSKELSEATKKLIRYFFIQATNCDVINLRQLLKGVNFQIPVLNLEEDSQRYIGKKFFDLGLKALFTIFNNKENFLEHCVLEILKKKQANARYDFNFDKYSHMSYKTFFKKTIFYMLEVLRDISYNSTLTVHYKNFETSAIKVFTERETVEIEDKFLERDFLIILANYILIEGYERYESF